MAQLLDIEPKGSISLQRVKGKTASAKVHLTNVKGGNVAFKIKTNKAELYSVRPNQGILRPGRTTVVTVTLKLLPADVSLLDHKFSILQTKTTKSEEGELAEVWTQVGATCRQLLRVTIASPDTSPELQRAMPTFPEQQAVDRDLQAKCKLLMVANQSQAALKEKLERRLGELYEQERELSSLESAQEIQPKIGFDFLHVAITLLLGLIFGLYWFN